MKRTRRRSTTSKPGVGDSARSRARSSWPTLAKSMSPVTVTVAMAPSRSAPTSTLNAGRSRTSAQLERAQYGLELLDDIAATALAGVAIERGFPLGEDRDPAAARERGPRQLGDRVDLER